MESTVPSCPNTSARAFRPGQRLGRYVMVAPLGQGGMAEVYLARMEGPAGFEKPVALKVIHPHRVHDPEHRRMLFKEARIAASLIHPNIVQVLDVDVADGESFLAMEYIHGRDVRDIMAALPANAALPLDLALLIVREIAIALHHAHSCNDPSRGLIQLVHRDVSPSNIIVSYAGDVKLADFGIAKVDSNTDSTRTGTLKGKFGYMAPEQMLQETLDGRADVFALAVVLYELTTGHRAFRGSNAFSVMNKVLSASVRPPQALVPDYPPALARIVERGMALEAEDRHPSAGALAEAIDRFCAVHSIQLDRRRLAEFVGNLFSWPPIPSLTIAAEPDTSVPRELADTRVETPARPARTRIGVSVAAALVVGAALGWVLATEGAEPGPTRTERASAVTMTPLVEASRPAPEAQPAPIAVDAPIEGPRASEEQAPAASPVRDSRARSAKRRRTSRPKPALRDDAGKDRNSMELPEL